METETQQIDQRRLSYGEISKYNENLQKSVEVQDVIKALKHPTVDNFQKAVELLHQGYHQRFQTILETAQDQSVSVGEPDLRRLKRQFSSLKNTFLHYEVKEEFIAALADGLPNGTEEVQLAQFEEEVTRNVEQLRALKANNEEAQQAINEIIVEVVKLLQALQETSAALADRLAALQKETQRHDAEMAQLPLPPPLDEAGLDEAQCQEALAAATAETRELETRIVTQTDVAADLEAILATERHEVEVLRAQLADAQAQKQALAAQEGNEPTPINSRFNGTMQWADQATELISSLAGLSLIAATKDHIALQVTTTFPAGPVIAGTLGSCISAQHELHLHLSSTHKGRVVSAELKPADIDISDIVVAASNNATAEVVVRDIRSRLSGYLHRKGLFTAATAKYPTVTVVDAGNFTIVKAILPKAPVVEVKMVTSWPAAADDVVEIIKIEGAADSARAGKLQGLVLEGRGFLQALQTIQADLDAPADDY